MKNIINSYTFKYKFLLKTNLPLLIIPLFALLASTHSLKAQGNLLLTPKRVIFDGNKNSESINLANSGQDTATYVISLIHLHMKEDGSFEEITQAEAGKLSAEPYLRYFPRTVTLAPNEAQVIRMQFNKPGNMDAGEYRSHLYIRAVPKPKPLGENEVDKSASINVNLVPVFGISIPVFIRIGESNTSTNITEMSVNKSVSTPTLSLALNRSGNMSVYGDITVNYLEPNGKNTLIGMVQGLGIYSPNPVRKIVIPLDKNVPVNYTEGKIVVQFQTRGSNGKDKKITEAELAL